MKKLIFLFLFIGLSSFAQKKQKVDLSTPNATLYTHVYYLMPENYDIAKSASTVKGLPAGEAQFVAKRIKEIFDGNGLILDFSKVPIDANYIDTVDFGVRTLEHNANRYAPFPVRLPGVYIEKSGKNWYFSQETNENLDKIYKKTFPIEFSWFNKRFPEFFQTAVNGVLIWKPIAAVITLIICVILFYILEPIMFFILRLFQRIFFRKISDGRTMKILHELAKPIVKCLELKIERALKSIVIM